MASSKVTALLRTGVTPEMSSTDASRVVLLNAFALVAGVGSTAGLLVPSTYASPAVLLTVCAMIAAAASVFALQARGHHGVAAVSFLAAGLFVTLLPPLLVSPWGGHIFNLFPIAALPWLLVTSRRLGAALVFSALAVASYVAIVTQAELALDVRRMQDYMGDFAVINPAIVALLMALIGHFHRRIDVTAELNLERERLQSTRLVHDLLPEAVAERVINKTPTRARRHGDASVLFCAIDQFDEIMNEGGASELLRLLDALYVKFDELCVQHRVEKIKTFGGRYLVAAGVPRPREDHAEALASLALEMHKAAVGVCSTSGTPVRLRVGINSGPLVAGVIGRTRLTYDLWGDTVNIAQRMELHGRPGETQITPLTFSKINHRYICKPREHVDVKGREPMKTYVIRGRRPT